MADAASWEKKFCHESNPS